MSRPATFTASVVEKILTFLAPLFLDDTTGDTAEARQAARDTLATYGARTDRELRIAALTIGFGFGALDALSRAADPELALNQVIRLRGSANALNRAANQNENRLEKLRKQPLVSAADPDPAAATPNTDALPATSATPDLLAFVRVKPAPTVNTVPTVLPVPNLAPLSRQQRRAAERAAEKLRHQQQAEAKRAQRAAERSSTVYAAAWPAQQQPTPRSAEPQARGAAMASG